MLFFSRRPALIGLAFVALLALPGVSLAETLRHGALEIVDARVRAAHGAATAGYALIRNTGSSDDRLVSVSAEIAGRSEIHTMAVVDGIMKMRSLPDGLVIPAGGEVELKPKGLHLMLMKLKSRPKPGDSVMIELVFENAGAVRLSVPVVKMMMTH